MPEKPWSLSIASINITGMNSTLWQCVTALHKSNQDIIFVKETMLHDRESVEKFKYAWNSTSDVEAYISKAESNRAGGVAMLLLATASILLRNK